MLHFVTGDILGANVDALVNPVNTAGVMGKGLALQFKKAFPDNFAAYRTACKRGEVRIGKIFVFEAAEAMSPRFILNFPTKRHWRESSRLEYIDEGLRDPVAVVRARGIRSLAVPALGSGLGGLDWDDVRPRIETSLRELRDVEAFVFEAGAPPPSRAPGGTET